jgi:hypothetical protein
MRVIVSDIRHRAGFGTLRFECEPRSCVHSWEFHLWDMGDAYCPRCGSLATADNDPRVDRSDGHMVFLLSDGRRQHALACHGCSREKDLTANLAVLSTLWTNLGVAGALCSSFDLGAAPAQRNGLRPWWPLCGRNAL